MEEPILGCIADDLTGATYLRNNLVRGGMRVTLAIDVPVLERALDADAIVVALKSRTIPAIEAQAQSLRACVERSGELVEQAPSAIARAHASQGAGQLAVAGGETAGVCVRALGIEQMKIGPQIGPGVPWCYASFPLSPQGRIYITLKSGNFGSQDFFGKAFMLIN